jgi:hypothetical protein
LRAPETNSKSEEIPPVLVLETTPKLDDEALILENIAILLLVLVLLLPTTENNPNFALKFTLLKQ